MFAVEIVDKVLKSNTKFLSIIGEHFKLYKPVKGTIIDIIDGRIGEENVLYNIVKYASDKQELVFLSLNTGEHRGDSYDYLIVEMNSKGFAFAVKHDLYSENIEEFCKSFWNIKNAAGELKYDWDFNEFAKQYSINSYVPIRILNKPYKGVCSVSVCCSDGKLYDRDSSMYRNYNNMPTAKLYLDFKNDKDVPIEVDGTIQAYLTRIDTEKKLLKFELKPKHIYEQTQSEKSENTEVQDKEVYTSSGKSPFAYFTGEIIDDVSIIKSPINISYDIRQGYINDEALVICKIVAYFGFMTSKLLSFALKNLTPVIFNLTGRYEKAYLELKTYANTSGNLQKYIIGKMVNTYGLLDAHRFKNPDEKNPSTLIISISRNGLALLKSRELVSELEAYDKSKDTQEAEKLKRKLAEVQLLLIQLAYFKETGLNYLKGITIIASDSGSSNKPKARPSFIVYFNNNSIIYEVIRRGPEGHDKKVLDKLSRIGAVAKLYATANNKGILMFKQQPKIVFICEDIEHIQEIDKIVKNFDLIGEDSELFYSYDRAVANIDLVTKDILIEKYAISHYKVLTSGALEGIQLDNIINN